MADKRRFVLFADLVVERFPSARRIFDIAGGMGQLNVELTSRGRDILTFDSRHKHLPVRFAERRFGLDEPCECDLVIGLHPDGATRVIVEYAVRHRVPFAIVPCCPDNGMSYRPWMRHLRELATAGGLSVEEAALAMSGRARVLLAAPEPGTTRPVT